jgi:phytoene desaturase
MIKPNQKVVIVGAGPGGLAAAILLQRSGVDVTVVERREVVGGRTSTMEQNGFKFDTGPTFFLYPRVLREIFAAAGRDLDEEIPMYRLDPQYRLVFGSGGELLATPNLERMERAIAQLSPEDARGFHRFFCDNRNKLEVHAFSRAAFRKLERSGQAQHAQVAAAASSMALARF